MGSEGVPGSKRPLFTARLEELFSGLRSDTRVSVSSAGTTEAVKAYSPLVFSRAWLAT